MTDIEPVLDQFVECFQDKVLARMMDLCKRGNLKLLTPLIQKINPKVAELCLLLIQLEDLKDEVKAGVRNPDDLPTQQEEATEKL